MDDSSDLTPLDAPREGVPPVITSAAQLRALAEKVANGTGPIAWDAERASGYRYHARAYLVQGRREGVGTFLIDPVTVPELGELREAYGDTEWILHAANQDLPCLRDLGLYPGGELFDTELGARLAGFERVGLGYLIAECFGLSLAKEHSAVDWSTRPLPEPWLTYAALDVELLIPLRDIVAKRLAEQGKTEWARQEFAHVAAMPAPRPKPDPWRRTSGGHTVKHELAPAMIRELWHMRDAIAQAADRAPGKVINDRALVAIVAARPRDMAGLKAVKGLNRATASNYGDKILAALDRARALPKKDRPGRPPRSDGPPPQKMWESKRPAAAKRLEAAKKVVEDLVEQHGIPAENLMTPSVVRAVCWDPVDAGSREAISEQCLGLGARQWQAELVAPALVAAWATR